MVKLKDVALMEVSKSKLGPLRSAPADGTSLTNILLLTVNDQLNVSFTGRFTLDQALAPASQGKKFKQAREGLDTWKNAHALRSRQEGDDFQKKLWIAPSEFWWYTLLTSEHVKKQMLRARLENRLQDKKFQALYITVVQIFTNQLRADISATAPSFAAKWVPTPGHSADKQLLFASALATVLFGGDRNKLQKVLTKLRKELKVPEVEMVKGPWKIDYPRVSHYDRSKADFQVPSRAMSRSAEHFETHDPDGFNRYLDQVALGTKSISGASLFPHEILMDAMKGGRDVASRIADLQWKSLIESIASSGQLTNCLAIADVSGSMGSFGGDKKMPTPLTVCIALTLLLGELAAEPWNGCFFTFSSEPTCESIDPKLPLSKRASTVQQAHWEMSTAYYKVFDLILERAKQSQLKPEDMVKKLFVFSDMQFDQATGGGQSNEHQKVREKFKAAGYPMPELVYWNLAYRHDGSQPSNKPVQADQKVWHWSRGIRVH